ncbi:MAG: YIP1 family protein [Acidimicrobiia bacterium]|nr:MAG: YIP1 family protein [Acidimicrobiia bacterium]
MIRRALEAALLRREPYLIMVVRPDGVADGAIVVAITHALLSIPFVWEGGRLLLAVRVVLSGVVAWIVISGLIYLIGRHLLEGDGSFAGTMAATSIGFPVLLTALLLAPFISPLRSTLVASVWLVATLWVAAKVALDLPPARAAAAATGGWLSYVVISLLFRL